MSTKRTALTKALTGVFEDGRTQYTVFYDDGSTEDLTWASLPASLQHGRLRKSVNFAAYWGLWRSLRLVTWDSTKWLAKNGGMAIASIPLVGLGYYGLEKVGAFEFVRSLIG